jgi:RHS repeat-associated protein
VVTYKFSYAPATDTWTLDTVNEDQEVVRRESRQMSGSQRDYVVYEGEEQEVYRVREAWEEVSGVWLLMSTVVDPAGVALTTTRNYYPTGAGAGRLKSIQYPDGSWEMYEYDSAGRVTRWVRPWGDGKMPDAPANPGDSTVRMVEYSYDLPDPPDSDPRVPDDSRPSSIIESVYTGSGPLIVGVQSYTYIATRDDTVYNSCIENHLPPDPEYCERLARVVEVTESRNAGDSTLETVTTYLRAEDRVHTIQYPDDRLDTYSYDMGSLVGGVFDPYFGETHRRVMVVHGTVEYPDGVPGLSTRDSTITDYVGNTVRVSSEGYFGNPVIAATAFEYDLYGRVITESGAGGGTIARVYEDCCRTETVTDETGIETEYKRDVLGHLDYAIKAGAPGTGDYPAQGAIKTDYTYDAVGRLLSTTVAPDGGGGPSLRTSRTYDLAGRLLSETNENTNLTTTYDYDTATGGEQLITVTHPGGATETNEYSRDGRVKTITGTAVVARSYEYSAETVGNAAWQWAAEYVGQDGTASPRRTKTWTDMAGRTALTERPAFETGTVEATYHYDNHGWLQCVESSAAGVPTQCYEYDVMGNVFRSGLDIDGEEGLLDLDSNDRITESATSYVYDDQYEVWYQETTTKVYATAESRDATTTSRVRRRLPLMSSGSAAYSESFDIFWNQTTHTITINRGSKLVTETTNVPGSTEDAVSVAYNGLPVSTTTTTGLRYTYGYDAIGRRTTTTDPRTGPSTTYYNETTGRVDYVEDAALNQTRYGYEPTTGRLAWVMKTQGKALGPYTRYDYNHRGQLVHTWGDVPQPTEFGYNYFGERTSLTTFRGGANWADETWPGGSGDTTTWTYDPATGLLTAKSYADASSVRYGYTPDGRLHQRTWARDVLTTYGYDAATGDLTTITYSDSTPGVTFVYDRLGRKTQVTDGPGQTDFGYDPTTLQLLTETITGDHYERLITRSYEVLPGQAEAHASRPSGLTVGTSQDPDADYATAWHYDDATDHLGRLNRVTGPGLPAYGAVYAYERDSDLVAVTGFMADESTTRGTASRTFEGLRDVVESVSNRWGTTTVSQYEYRSDALARRTSVVNTGAAFNPNRFTLWTYNDRNELLSSRRYNGTNINDPRNPVTTQQFVFAYDPIGNRLTYQGDGLDGPREYTANSLNQYTWANPPEEKLEYDADGNLTQDGRQTYVWDGENRLIAVEPLAPVQGRWENRVEFAYDYLGRRVRKQAFPRSGGGWSTTPSLDRRFVYDGWNLLEELNGLSSNAVLTKFTWGLDLSGQNGNSVAPPPSAVVPGLHGAGGIGGLLAMTDTKGTQTESDDVHLVYFYDANGNIGQLVNADSPTATIRARYEYYPFGGILTAAASATDANPFRFSTKYRDAETALYYYGHRYLIPRLGRWVNRDPIGESGSAHLYAAVRNNPCFWIDPDGLEEQTSQPASQPAKPQQGRTGPIVLPPPKPPTPKPPIVVPPPEPTQPGPPPLLWSRTAGRWVLQCTRTACAPAVCIWVLLVDVDEAGGPGDTIIPSYLAYTPDECEHAKERFNQACHGEDATPKKVMTFPRPPSWIDCARIMDAMYHMEDCAQLRREVMQKCPPSPDDPYNIEHDRKAADFERSAEKMGKVLDDCLDALKNN